MNLFRFSLIGTTDFLCCIRKLNQQQQMHVFYVKNNGTVARMGATLYKDTIAVFGKI